MGRTRTRVPITRDSALLSGVMYSGGRTALAPHLPDPIQPGAEPVGAKGRGSTVSGTGGSTRPLIVVTLPKSKESAGSTAVRGTGAAGGSTVSSTQSSTVSSTAGEPGGLVGVYCHAIAQLVNDHGYRVVLQAVDGDSDASHDRYLGAINRLLAPGAPRVVAHAEVGGGHSFMAGVDAAFSWVGKCSRVETMQNGTATVSCFPCDGFLPAASMLHGIQGPQECSAGCCRAYLHLLIFKTCGPPVFRAVPRLGCSR